MLKPLYTEINSDLDNISNRIATLAQRPDLSSLERTAMQGLLAKWQICKNQAKDTIDIGQTDAPMATMMLGQTDDAFKAVDTDLQDLSAAISYTASNMSTQLYSDAEWTEKIVIIITLAALLISTFVAVVVGQSIVRPIKSITDVMRRLSAGETNVEIGYRDRRDEIGQMVSAIDIFRKHAIERHAMQQTLTEAIEAISEGFLAVRCARQDRRLQYSLQRNVFIRLRGDTGRHIVRIDNVERRGARLDPGSSR